MLSITSQDVECHILCVTQGENLEVVWAEFSTLSQAVLLKTPKLHSLQTATSKVENSAQVLSC
jgi:hypothetical protein